MTYHVEDLDDDQYVLLIGHLQAITEIVGIDPGYVEGLVDAVDDAVSLAGEE